MRSGSSGFCPILAIYRPHYASAVQHQVYRIDHVLKNVYVDDIVFNTECILGDLCYCQKEDKSNCPGTPYLPSSKASYHVRLHMSVGDLGSSLGAKPEHGCPDVAYSGRYER